MNQSEIRAILSAYRAGEPEMDEARFQQAKAEAKAHPDLAKWWAEQEDLDRAISSKLQSGEVPRDLKALVTSWERRTVRSTAWNRRVLLAAASIVALAVLFGSWRGPFQPAASLADYRDEMVSFVKLDPPLELKSSRMTEVTDFLKESGAPGEISVPRKLQGLAVVTGCRTLRFRGEDVALVCFRRAEGDLVHLFVMDRKGMAKLRHRSDQADYATLGDWMTAAWTEGDNAYLLAGKGGRAALEKFLGSS